MRFAILEESCGKIIYFFQIRLKMFYCKLLGSCFLLNIFVYLTKQVFERVVSELLQNIY